MNDSLKFKVSSCLHICAPDYRRNGDILHLIEDVLNTLDDFEISKDEWLEIGRENGWYDD